MSYMFDFVDYPTITIKSHENGDLIAACLCGMAWSNGSKMSFREVSKWALPHWFNECEMREVKNV
jgi:hypothetical protein